MDIGEKIRHIRIQQNMTQKELGEKLGGIPQQQIGRWENGKANPKLDTIQKIAAALSIPISTFFELEENYTSKEFMQLIELCKEEYKELNKDNDIRHYLLIYYYDKMEQIGRDSLIEILSNLKILNDIGQKEASKRVEELTAIPRYTNKENENLPDKKE